ncbi:hypothetical protein ACKWTF_015351 [Chironomus riparius]
MWIVLPLISFVAVVLQCTSAVDIVCSYTSSTIGYALTTSSYHCVANKLIVYSREDAIVDDISGIHRDGKTNEDVLGFLIYGTNIPYFLKNLDKHFKNLKAILIQASHLKELHQADLKPFPNLLGLYLSENDIQVIEEGLFDFNPNLIEIRFQSNKIVHISANVFDNLLRKLSYLYLGYNICISKNALNPSTVKDLIREIKFKLLCQNAEFLNLESKIKAFKNGSESFDPQIFKIQLAEIEVEANNSKYAEFFTTQVEALKAIKIVEATTTTHNPTDAVATTLKPCMCEASNQSSCTKVSDLKPILDEIKDLRASGQDQQSSQNETFLTFEDKIQFIEDSLISFQASTAKRLQTIEDDQKLSEFRISKKIDSVAKRFDAMEEKLEKIFQALNNKAQELITKASDIKAT